jgi:glycosyltransferase involved in cell wall biosynthesis
MKDVGPETGDLVPFAAAPRNLSGKRTVAVMYSTYPFDARPRRAAEALTAEGASVEVLCLKETEKEPQYESFNGVEITRILLRRPRGGKLSYVIQYALFTLLSAVILAGRACKRRYDLIHVHSMPDVLVLSALVPKLLGAKVILDLHDPMPELMMTIFALREDSCAVRILKRLEKWSVRFADAVLTLNTAFKKIFLARSCPPEKIGVVMNSPDEAVFPPRKPSKQVLGERDISKPFVIMYHGSLVERHGLDLAVIALGKIKKSIPNAELRIYGRSTPFLQRVLDSARNSDLNTAVRYFGPRKLEQIPEAIRECDVGVIPNQRSRFCELNMPTRIFEYLSQGMPVIAPRTPGILDYFGAEDLVFFKLGDADDLAAKFEYVFRHPRELIRFIERGQGVYRPHKWASERLRFLSLVGRLLERCPSQHLRHLHVKTPPVVGR